MHPTTHLFLFTFITMDAEPLQKSDHAKDDEEESDLELDGVDVEDIGEAEEEGNDVPAQDAAAADEDGQNDSKKPAAATEDMETNDDEEAARKDLEAKEEAELEAAKRERQELFQSAAASGDVGIAAATGMDGNSSLPMDAKMTFLLKQSDVFTQFLAGVVASETTKKNKKNAAKGGRGRMSEQEEDARLLKSAQSKLRVVRLDHQPGNLAPHCKMHPYQLEGLNWLISTCTFAGRSDRLIDVLLTETCSLQNFMTTALTVSWRMKWAWYAGRFMGGNKFDLLTL
jgi:hypothetical protein